MHQIKMVKKQQGTIQTQSDMVKVFNGKIQLLLALLIVRFSCLHGFQL